MASIGRIIATFSFLSYGFVLAFEWWRPGFVTYFWNPEILLLVALFGAILSVFGPDSKHRFIGTFAFLLLFAIVSVLAIWYSLPSMGSKIMMSASVIIIFISLGIYYQRESIGN